MSAQISKLKQEQDEEEEEEEIGVLLYWGVLEVNYRVLRADKPDNAAYIGCP